MNEDNENREKSRALLELGRIIFGRNNLIGSDFEDAKALRIKRKFVQDSAGGILIQFSVSCHALGKVDSKELGDALEKLLEPADEDR